MVFGDLGDDVVHGGGGADVVQGGAGDDTVVGDGGDDRVYGGKGDDLLSGGPGADWLFGDIGNDVLTGGDGPDRFCFPAGGGGLDMVADFSRSDGDVLWISAALAGGFDEIAAHISASAAGDAVITLGAQTIVLAGVAPGSLAASDFLFG
jgi:Ca2+-binding RTX toxin-like protein